MFFNHREKKLARVLRVNRLLRNLLTFIWRMVLATVAGVARPSDPLEVFNGWFLGELVFSDAEMCFV